jgi:hypothetical protein
MSRHDGGTIIPINLIFLAAHDAVAGPEHPVHPRDGIFDGFRIDLIYMLFLFV